MKNRLILSLLFTVMLAAPICSLFSATAQGPRGASRELIEQRHQLEAELQSIAIVERKVMIAMRDGQRMAADIYRPKDTSKKYPTVFVRTPYNFNFWDVRSGRPAT